MNRTGWISLVAASLLLGSGCDEEEDAATPLVDDEGAALLVTVVQEGEPSTSTVTTDIRSDSNVVVASAQAFPDVVPIWYGEPDADPEHEYLLVTVDVDPAYADRVTQVELNIDVGSAGTELWCEPLKRDDVQEGRFYLKLQPACAPEDRDELTDLCVLRDQAGVAIDSREDRLTFTLWNDTPTGECHAGSGAE